MLDINTLFGQLIKDKGALYVANKLMHKDTSRVKRWEREKVIPLSHRFAVMIILKADGFIK